MSATEPKLRKALIIAYHFPPDASSGTFRTLKFVKYLSHFGWQPVVLTVAPEHEPLENKDPALVQQIPASTQVERTYAWSLSKLRRRRTEAEAVQGRAPQAHRPHAGTHLKRTLMACLQFPDRAVGWYPFAVWRGWRLARQEDIRVIYVSAPPFTVSLVGLTLHFLTGKPLVSDFRDPWIGNVYNAQLPPFLDRTARWLEYKLLNHSARIINVSTLQSLQTKRRLPPPGGEACVVITNGFDPDERVTQCAKTANGEFRITYTGAFYTGRREPRFFLQALSLLQERNPNEFRRTQVSFVGDPKWAKDNAEWIESLRLGNHVRFLPFCAHAEALVMMAQSDALLLIVSTEEKDTGTIPAKVFEYLVMQKPILALAHDGAAAEVVRTSGIGVVADPQNPEAILDGLRELYSKCHSGRGIPESFHQWIKRYDGQVLTQQLAQLFDEVTAPVKPAR